MFHQSYSSIYINEIPWSDIYIPDINWIYINFCVAVTFGFENQKQNENAYGTAICRNGPYNIFKRTKQYWRNIKLSHSPFNIFLVNII